MIDEIIFDERAWIDIEYLLPDNEETRRTILDDFIWFNGRPKKYKNVNKKVDDYIRHLKLKAASKISITHNLSEVFGEIDIESIESCLKSRFCKHSE
jgi:hypothetical protein